MSEDTQAPSGFSRSLDKMPWWAQFIVFVGMTFGVPVVMVGWYLARDAGYIANPIVAELGALSGYVEELKGISLRHEETTRQMVETLEAEAEKRKKRCVMRARTDADKEACFAQ